MSICPDGQGICKRNKNNQPSCSSVSRDEGSVCFPPLNQSLTICWACWQLPSVANSLRDMTFAPRYQDTASRITTTKHVFLSLFSKALPESYTQTKENAGQCRGLETEMTDKSWSFGKGLKRLGVLRQQSRQVSTAHRRCSETCSDLSGKAINAKPWGTVGERLTFKDEKRRALNSDVPARAQQTALSRRVISNRLPQTGARVLPHSWALKVLNDTVLRLLAYKDDTAS